MTKKKPYVLELITVFLISGKEVAAPKNQLEVARLANCAIDLYAMTAVLGRASRSYCIGLKNSVHEVGHTNISDLVGILSYFL